MGKRKREEDDDDYVNFCVGLQRESRDGKGDTSFVYSRSRPYKRYKINPNFYKPSEVSYRYVDSTESIYKKILDKITNPSIVIDEILEVKNSVLEDAYDAKMIQKMRVYGTKVKEELLFHGTKESNLASICTFNFDWRLNGSNKGHKFGKGVCFSRNAKYASNYSDRYAFNKVMIVAKVLVSEVCQGHHDMSIPPQGYDTSQKGKNGAVLVKYEDNEFFPAYVLYYHFDFGDRQGDYYDQYERRYDNYFYKRRDSTYDRNSYDRQFFNYQYTFNYNNYQWRYDNRLHYNNFTDDRVHYQQYNYYSFE